VPHYRDRATKPLFLVGIVHVFLQPDIIQAVKTALEQRTKDIIMLEGNQDCALRKHSGVQNQSRSVGWFHTEDILSKSNYKLWRSLPADYPQGQTLFTTSNDIHISDHHF